MPEAKLSFIDFCNILEKKNVTHLFDICGEQMCLFIAPSYLFVITGSSNIKKINQKSCLFSAVLSLASYWNLWKKSVELFFYAWYSCARRFFPFSFPPIFVAREAGLRLLRRKREQKTRVIHTVAKPRGEHSNLKHFWLFCRSVY